MTMVKRKPAADAYDVHEKYWADSGGDVRLPISPFEIAEAMGVDVYLADLPMGDSGSLRWEEGRPVIVLNVRDGLTRQRFTCAHEIGHLRDCRNRGIKRDADRNERASRGTDPDEIYANRFAAALLMPKGAVKRLHGTGMSCAALARRFKVSQDAMQWRLANLGLTDR